MEIKKIVLSENEKQIMGSYSQFCDGLSHYLGKQYEIVLHNLENLDHSVIKIINGFYTGRKIGAPITDLALKMMNQIKLNPNKSEDVVYFTTNKRGDPLKSTTILIRGENNRIIGLMCINFYLNSSLLDYFKNFIPDLSNHEQEKKTEYFADNMEELISDIINKTMIEVENDLTINTNSKNKEIVHRLHEQGIFNLKGSVEFVSKSLDLSKNTVYLHLRNNKNE